MVVVSGDGRQPLPAPYTQIYQPEKNGMTTYLSIVILNMPRVATFGHDP